MNDTVQDTTLPARSNRTFVFVGATLVGLGVLLGGNFAGQAMVAGLAKAFASTAFIATAVACGAWTTRYGRVILAGLALSWFGDVFLIGRSDALFLAGLVSFLSAHVAYCAAFAVQGIARRWVAMALGGLLPVVGIVLWWLLPHVDGPMTGPVLAYIAVITAMVMLSWGARGAGAHWSVPLGAALFYLSDIAVARNRFVDTESFDWVWGLPLYYVAQLFLAYSVSKASATRR